VRPYAYFRQFTTTGQSFPFSQLLSQVNSGAAPKTLSLEGFKSLLRDLVRLVLDYKKDIVRDDPGRYTRLVSNVLQSFVCQQSAGAEAWHRLFPSGIIPRGSLRYLPDELADELVAEAVLEPSGLKPLNPVLAQLPAYVPLTVTLLIRNLKKLAQVIDHGKTKSVTDEFGFLPKFSTNFPPLPSDPSSKAEPWTGSVHSFERAIIKKRLLQNADQTISKAGIGLYKQFVLKVLTAANESEDKKLAEHAIGAHFRLCRFLLGKTRDDLVQLYMHLLLNIAVHPLVFSVGHKTGDDFATRLFESVLVHIPIVGANAANPYPLYSIVHRLIHASRCPLLPDSEVVAASLVSLVLDRLFRKLPTVWQRGVAGYTPDELTYQEAAESRSTTALWKRYDASHAPIVPAGFRDLILRHPFSAKAADDFKQPLVEREVFEAEASAGVTDASFGVIDASFGASAKVFGAALSFLANRLATYADDQFATSSTFLVRQLASELKVVFPGSIAFVLQSPVPANIDSYVAKRTKADYTRALNAFTLNPKLSLGSVPVLQNYATLAKSPLFAEILADLASKERYALFQKVVTFAPVDPRVIEQQRLPPYGERVVPNYTPTFAVSIQANAYVTYRLNNYVAPAVPKSKVAKPQKATTARWKTDKFYDTLAQLAIGPILAVDGEKFVGASPDADSFVILATAVSKYVRHLRTPPADIAIFGHLLRAAIADLCIVDPEPTEENPSPAPIPTYSGLRRTFLRRK
jgi:hypothetical protein